MKILIDCRKKIVCLSQKSYFQKIRKSFLMSGSNAISFPLGSQFKLYVARCPNSNENIIKMQNISYATAIESLMYAMLCSRLDIAFPVNVLSRYMFNLGLEHWKEFK